MARLFNPEDPQTCTQCHQPLRPEDKYCRYCGQLREEYSTDYEGRCGHCHKPLHPEDKYCRYCGFKRGKGEFAPYLDEFYCIYGPMPVNRTHICPSCGYQWTTRLMVDNENHCPRCGSFAPATDKNFDPFRDPPEDDTSYF